MNTSSALTFADLESASELSNLRNSAHTEVDGATTDNLVDMPTYEHRGENVFDWLEDQQSTVQRLVLRTVANSALAGAIYAWNFYMAILGKDNVREDAVDEAENRAIMYSRLAAEAADQCDILKSTKYDEPMSSADMFDFLVKSSSNAYDRNKAVFEATLSQMELDAEQIDEVYKARERQLKVEAERQRKELTNRRDDILSELESYPPGQFTANTLTAAQHLKLMEKAHKKLRAESTRVLAFIDRYDDAASDALEYSAAAKSLDKVIMKFRRENRDDLRDAEARSE